MKLLVSGAQRSLFLAFCSSCLVIPLVGCDEGNDEADDGLGGAASDDSTASEWLGDTPHLLISGTVAGKTISLTVEGTEAQDLGTLYCERNFIVPDLDDESSWGEGYLQKIEFKFNFFYEDQLAEFQLEVEVEDLPSQEGKTITLGSQGSVAATLTLDPDGATEEEYEEEGAAGTVTIELVSGSPGDDGLLIPDETGAFGAYLNVELADGGSLKGSFTANCGENDLEVPEE